MIATMLTFYAALKYILDSFLIFRVPEAVLIIIVTTSCIYLIATLLGTCIHERKIHKEEIMCPGLYVR